MTREVLPPPHRTSITRSCHEEHPHRIDRHRLMLIASSASAEVTVDEARATLVPFYKALNAEFAKDAPELIRQSTAPDWKTCRGNESCNSRDEVMAGIAQRLKTIPDLKW